MRKIIAGILLAAGLCLMLAPWGMDQIHRKIRRGEIEKYADTVQERSDRKLNEEWNRACEYNRIEKIPADLTEPGWEQKYEELLNPGADAVMGYLEMKSRDILLPIYHGTSEEVLQKGCGHLKESSLPVGGTGTHCVLTGHTGMPQEKLLTDLDRAKKGDTFTLHVLGHSLTYKVDQIRVVLPEQQEALMPVKGKDYCTLVTCTPYGVNTHRLLVRGRRVMEPVTTIRLSVTSDFSGYYPEKYCRSAGFVRIAAFSAAAGAALAGLFTKGMESKVKKQYMEERRLSLHG